MEPRRTICDGSVCLAAPDQPVSCGFYCHCGFCDDDPNFPCFGDEDYRRYKTLFAQVCRKAEVAILADCKLNAAGRAGG